MVLSMERWKGKTAIVTGASAGCGSVIAERLVSYGLQVVGLARRREKIEQLSEKLGDQPGKLYAVKADIAKREDVEAAFKWTTENLGPVHILVNNAGIIVPATFVGGDPQTWKDILDVNVFGLAIATQEAIKDMTANRVDGHVININSVLGHYVARIPDFNMYAPSKFAVTALTETLRQELNKMNSKIKITSISPGLIDTGFTTANLPDTNCDDVFRDLPKLQGEDVADAVVYALSTPPHVQVHELMIRPLGERV